MNHNQITSQITHPSKIGSEVREMFAGLQSAEIDLPYVPRSAENNMNREYSSTRLSFLVDDPDQFKNTMIHST
jgi:hypothetical protein